MRSCLPLRRPGRGGQAIGSKPTSVSLLLVLAGFAALLTPGVSYAGSDPSLKWKTIDSSPFQVHFYQVEEQLAAEFLALAHEAYAHLTDHFGFEPSEGIHIVVTDSTDSANGLATALPYNYIILYAYIPDAGGELGHWGDWKRILVYHELTHIFHLDRVTGLLRWLNYVLGKTYLPNSAMPTWFIEGLAVVKESRIGAGGRVGGPLFDMYLRVHALEGALLRLDEASGGSLTLPRGTIPYLYGSSFMHWLSESHGEGKLVAFVEEQAGKINPYSINISARRLFGKTFVELYGEWQQAETARARKKLAHLEEEGLKEGRRVDFGGERAPMPSFAPDGSLVWRLATGHETQHLKRLNPDGSTEKLHHCRGGCDRPSWPPTETTTTRPSSFSGRITTIKICFGWELKTVSEPGSQMGPESKTLRFLRTGRRWHSCAFKRATRNLCCDSSRAVQRE